MKIGNLEVYGVIYKIQNLVNGKVYIGQTTAERGFDGRYQNDLYKYTSNKHLKNAIFKYGIENFSINKVFDIAFSKKELDIKECIWIKTFNSLDRKYGYNISGGGSNGNPYAGKTDAEMSEIKNKMRENNLGKCLGEETRLKIGLSNKGRIFSEDTKKKISKSEKGKIVKDETRKRLSLALKGRTFSEETKKKMGESHKGMRHTEESKNKMRENNSNIRKVICTTTNKIFSKIKDGSEFYNCNRSKISKCCRNKQKTCGKLEDGKPLQWKYVEDLTPEEYIEYDIENKLKELELSNDDSSFLL